MLPIDENKSVYLSTTVELAKSLHGVAVRFTVARCSFCRARNVQGIVLTYVISIPCLICCACIGKGVELLNKKLRGKNETP